MNKKSLSFALLLLTLVYIPSVSADPITVPNPSEIIVSSIGIPVTADPHWAYDTASAELVMNVYGTLIFFDVDRTKDPTLAGLADQFVGDVAMSWVENGPPEASAPVGTDNTYYFEIRSGIPWQDPVYGTVTPADVEYSFERWMVMDRLGGPTWMIYEPCLGGFHADPGWANDTSNPINLAVESNSTHVWFNLVMPYPPFMTILAQSWASIIDKDWATIQGCWPGTWNNWLEWHDPPVSPLDDPAPVMMGSGPYKMDWVDYIAETWSIIKFDSYWGGWPAAGCLGYAERCTYLTVSEWAVRKALFLSNAAAQADTVWVPWENTAELEDPAGSGNALAGVRYWKDLPMWALSAAFFNFFIPTEAEFPGGGSPYIGDGTLSESSITPDFFTDVNIRKGFAYSFDWAQYIAQVFLGEASQPASPLIKGLGFDDLYAARNTGLCYAKDSAQATTAFQAAFGGAIWTTGFTFTITYNTGNIARETAALMLEANVEALNPKFHIEVQEVDWPTYLNDLVNYPYFKAKMPLFIIGWLADYPDPHNLFHSFMHTYGDFTYFQSYSNAAVDALLDAEIATTDRAVRYAAFEDLMEIYHDDIPSLALTQPVGRRYERTWLKGWYYQALGHAWKMWLYFYHLWKSDVGLNEIGVYKGDVNGRANAGCVNILDAGFLSSKWTAVGNPYDARADINQDASIGILDAGAVSGSWGDVPMNS